MILTPWAKSQAGWFFIVKVIGLAQQRSVFAVFGAVLVQPEFAVPMSNAMQDSHKVASGVASFPTPVSLPLR